ncbi:hypothetical protein HMPREF0973_02281 [Prevotella veroralis F0319]|uniref:Uncharacterized protein n=1 Tax=Prevotella veroralis F0319 TaxID=649761 RepID=C9MRL8_9BACT|nr:hypothetical protein HMPREF0973_02281 [Prevotella veroralis F0319]
MFFIFRCFQEAWRTRDSDAAMGSEVSGEAGKVRKNRASREPKEPQ